MLKYVFYSIAILSFISCSDKYEYRRYSDYSTSRDNSKSIFVATDRHEYGEGNNLTKILKIVADSNAHHLPSIVLLGGDNVGYGQYQNDVYSINDVKEEIYKGLDTKHVKTFFTYGSHDINIIEKYDPFFSGVVNCGGFYLYGITFSQVKFYTQEVYDKEAKIGYGYNGLDAVDENGVVADTAAFYFEKWAKKIKDKKPIVMMSHLPLHYKRRDNKGAYVWFRVINEVAKNHTIIFLYGHNHTLIQKGDTDELNFYLKTPGDSISIDSVGNRLSKVLNFYYANAGYLNLGCASLLTFVDKNSDDKYDEVIFKRYSCNDTTLNYFGSTRYRNPYVIKLK